MSSHTYSHCEIPRISAFFLSSCLVNSSYMCILFAYFLAIVPRDEWGAREPKLIERFSGQIPFVIIHHSYLPNVSYTESGCKAAMKNMQDLHQLSNGWNDIGYSFAVCGDGRIYMGRGYNVIGAHAPRYNDKSIGICIIGDWRSKLFNFEYFLHFYL